MPLTAGVGVWLAAVVVTALSVALVRRWALSRQLLDVPNARSSHTIPIPRGGGIAIVVVVIGGLVSAQATRLIWPVRDFVAIIATSTFVAVISLVDDFRSLNSWLRLSAHLLASITIAVVIPPPPIIDVPFIKPIHALGLATVLTVFWLVGLTNAYNFMDGVDGIAGSAALVIGMTLAIDGEVVGSEPLLWIGLLTSAASVGFLVFNWHPAKIFMGDVGSAFLGFIFASAGLLLARDNGSLSISMMLPVWPFVFDTLFTFLRRLGHGERVFVAHRSHLYQRLVIAGWSHPGVACLYAMLSGVGAVLLCFPVSPLVRERLAVSVLGVLATMLWWLVRIAEAAARESRSVLSL